MKLSLLLSTEMKSKGYSQTKLAQETGISQATLSNLLKGLPRSPSIATLHRLSQGLGIDVNVLMQPALDEAEVTTEERQVDSELRSSVEKLLRLDLDDKKAVLESINRRIESSQGAAES